MKLKKRRNYILYTYTLNGEKYSVQKSYRTLAISHEVDGENVTEVFSYIQTKEGMEFYSPITLGGMEVSKLVYDSASGTWKSEDGKAVLSGELLLRHCYLPTVVRGLLLTTYEFIRTELL